MAIVHAYHVWREVISSYALLTLLIDSGEKGMTACVLVCFDCVDKLWGNMGSYLLCAQDLLASCWI